MRTTSARKRSLATDVDFYCKGPVALFDRAALDPLPPCSDAFVCDRAYVELAREGRLFFYEGLDDIAGVLRVQVDDAPGAALLAYATKTVAGLLLEVPSGNLEIASMWSVAADARSDRPSPRRSCIEPGRYSVDAWVLDGEELLDGGPKPSRRASCFQGLVIGTAVWLAFCTLCYGMLASEGLAAEALRVYLTVGLAPVLLAVALFYATGSRAEFRAGAPPMEIPDVPDVLVALTRVASGDAPRTGGGLVHPLL
jgi:hypothetical protein